MITPMMKYSLILYHNDYQEFLTRLQDLGLVDITITNWETTDSQRALMTQIEAYRQAGNRLRELEKEEAAQASDKGTKQVSPASTQKSTTYPDSKTAYEAYRQALARLEELNGELNRLTKEIEELQPWGAFDASQLESLREGRIDLYFYTLFTKEYEAHRDEWSQRYALSEISRDSLRTYFIVATPSGEEPEIDAQPMKAPTADYRSKQAEADQIRDKIAEQRSILVGCIPYREAFEQEGLRLTDQLHLEKVSQSGHKEADDTLILLEGWAPAEKQQEVEAVLNETGAFYLKERPTPEDDVPVLLKNGKFARLFELIGNFYALPKYGTMDLTRYFGPFYMIFFGFCLADAGYGLLLALGGLYLLLKGGPKLNSVAKLTMLCGGATIVFGFLMGSFFGIDLKTLPIFAGIKDKFLVTDDLFTLAIALGIFQLLFGMTLKVITITRQFGFKYTFSTLGWMIVIVSSLAAYLLPDMGVQGFALQSPAYWVCAGIGLFMMLFLNSPGKNPLVNFGAGLWNTYNDVTGILGDVLSYIRLFAIGLSGGILALVFNQLAFGLSPDIPVVGAIVTLIILLIGHGINLFMSTLSSFVHPMRLTFVEFYKSAGFESTQRAFKPLKHSEKD